MLSANGRSCKREETLAIAEISMLSSLNGESEDDSEFWYRKPPESPLSPRGLRNVTDFSTNHSSRSGVLKKHVKAIERVKTK